MRVCNKKIIKDGVVLFEDALLADFESENSVYIKEIDQLVARAQHHMDNCDPRRAFISIQEIWIRAN